MRPYDPMVKFAKHETISIDCLNRVLQSNKTRIDFEIQKK